MTPSSSIPMESRGLLDILSDSITGRPHIPKLTPEDWSSLIGIITAIIGNILISFALNTQRYAHIRLEREANGRSTSDRASSRSGTGRNGRSTSNGHARNDDDEEYDETDALLPKSRHSESDSDSTINGGDGGEKLNEHSGRTNYLRSPYWWAGIILMVIGEAGNFLAYGFAPASIVSPLGVVALISNCLIAPIMLKEQFRKRDLLGVVIAVGGAVTVVFSAKGSNPKLGPDQIWNLIKRWEFLLYLGITVALILVLMVASNKYGDKTILIDIGLFALFGGYTALSTKGVASLFSYRLFEIFTFWISYLLVFVLVLTAIMQIKYVNRALQRFDSTQVIPTQFVAFTISVVLGSAILYREFEKTTAAKVGQFVGGVFLTFLGVWCITSGRSNGRHSPEGKHEGDEEHEINLVDEEAPTPSPPATPKQPRAHFPADPTTPNVDSPASFATATSHLGPTPGKFQKPAISASTSSPTVPKSISRSKSSATAQPQTAPSTPRPGAPLHSTSDTPLQTVDSPATTTATPSSSVPRQFRSRPSIAAGITPGPYLSPLNAGVRAMLSGRTGSSDPLQPTPPLQRSAGRRRSLRHRASVAGAEALSSSVDDGAAASSSGDPTVADSLRSNSVDETVLGRTYGERDTAGST